MGGGEGSFVVGRPRLNRSKDFVHRWTMMVGDLEN